MRGPGSLKIREFEFHQPSGVGIFTGVDYRKFFLAPGTQLKCIIQDDPQSAAGSVSGSEMTYYLTPPIVKAAAFEAFVRICFSLHVAQNTIYATAAAAAAAASSSGAAPPPQAKESTFIAATVEALTTLLKADHDQQTKQLFAQIFADAVQDKPPRVALQGVAANNPWYCSGWSDVHGYTVPLTGELYLCYVYDCIEAIILCTTIYQVLRPPSACMRASTGRR